MAEWYYIEGGQTRGPVDDEAIRVLASVGRLTAVSQLMQSGSSQWSTLGAFEAQLGLQRSATRRLRPHWRAASAAPAAPGRLCASSSGLRRAASWVRGAAPGVRHGVGLPSGIRPGHRVRVALLRLGGSAWWL